MDSLSETHGGNAAAVNIDWSRLTVAGEERRDISRCRCLGNRTARPYLERAQRIAGLGSKAGDGHPRSA